MTSAPGSRASSRTSTAASRETPLETAVLCPSCGAENREGRKFCADCGRPLGLTCSACGAGNMPGERFCGECGTPLTAPAVESREAPAAERRLVSVLFADLVGFTTLSETRDAEEVRELLSRYFDSCRRIISLYGGTVEKFIGDAVMGVWGTPSATEDDAAVTVGATGQGMVAGDLVNTASRVQSVAEPGSVFVGEATRRATEHSVA